MRSVAEIRQSFRRSFGVAGAFFRLGLRQELSYPLGFVTKQLSGLVPIVIFFFVSQLVDRPDYFLFVAVGLIATRFIDATMKGFSTDIDIAINRGWLEMFLVEPVRWGLLPISMVQWRAFMGLINGVLMTLLAILLGAEFSTDQLGIATLILFLGLVAGLAISTLSASLKILAKSGDPILFVYGLAVSVFSGVFFPVETLPEFLRPISLVIPHTYMIAALRQTLIPESASLGGVTLSSAVLALLIFCLVTFPVAMWLYGRALEYGRKLGVLAGY